MRNRGALAWAADCAASCVAGSGLAPAGANTSMPLLLMRKVCRPGSVGWPRIFMISILRTIELRCTLWRNQIRPSATVNTGLASVWVKYSPIKKVVACQLVISMPNCCTNCCNWLCEWCSDACASTTERNESTNTSAGLCAVTSSTMRRSTRLRSPAIASSDRLTKRTLWLRAAPSKNANCCW